MTSDSMRLLAFAPSGLRVRGTLDPAKPPVHPQLAAAFAERHAWWLQHADSTEGVYDGERAVLCGFRGRGDELVLHTAFRTYTEGRALSDALALAASDGFREHEQALLAPDARLSWGFALNAFVLLPGGHALCGRRSTTVAVAPGQWTPCFSEIVEPRDMNWRSMQPLLQRLLDEELAAFRELGAARLVGLGVLPHSYTWVLLATLDLRALPMEQVQALLTLLTPDAETAAWGVVSLADDELHTYPDALYPQEQVDASALEVARLLAQRCAPALG